MTKDKRTYLNGVKLEHRHFSFIAGVISEMPDHAPSLRAQTDDSSKTPQAKEA